MRRIALLLALSLGCAQATAPAPTLRFSLTTVDSHQLPWVPIGWPADQPIQAGELNFGSISGLTDGAQGFVIYSTRIAGQAGATHLSYTVTGSTLRINLCPIGASCTAIVSEFVGSFSNQALTLTYTIGGTANSVFEFTVAAGA